MANSRGIGAVVPIVFALGGAFAIVLPPRPARGHETIEASAAASASASGSTTQINVIGEKAYSAASDEEVRNRDLMLRPRVRPGDILEVVPGLFVVQHSGGGKANQYFIRGFDADHGTDVSISVDGVPVNMPSHGHGQGFADLHFLIPELVSTLVAHKGPYSARYGDFATAAAIDLRTYDHLHESSVTVQAGRFGIYRGLFMVSPDLGDDWSTIVAGEVYAANGPFTNPERLKRFNGFARASRHVGPGTLSMTFMTYTSGWRASGQVPLRAVGTPELPTAFDAIDPTEGGSTQRHMASVSYHYAHDDDEVRALVFATKYRFTLFSNFTLYADDPVLGDQIEQDDDRTILGTSWSFTRTKKLGPIGLRSTFGLQARSDSIDNGLHRSVRRKLIGTTVDAGVQQTSIGVFTEQDVRLTRWLRAIAGLRADRFDVAVRDRTEQMDPNAPSTSGIAGSTLASPKISWVFSPLAIGEKPQGIDLDVYLNYGRGFHSNDARGAVRSVDRVTLLTKATGYELGVRLALWKRLDLAAALFRLDLDSETVWSGDAGTTEVVGPSRRTGIEIEGRLKVLPWLFLDADATFTSAVFRDNAGNANAVTLAPTRTFAGGISAKHPSGFFGAVRIRSIARRPANEGADRDPAQGGRVLDAEGWTLFDAMAGYRWRWLEGAVDVRNVFNSEWKEVQFANSSRTRSEAAAGAEPVQDIHFTPGWPLTVLGRITAYF